MREGVDETFIYSQNENPDELIDLDTAVQKGRKLLESIGEQSMLVPAEIVEEILTFGKEVILKIKESYINEYEELLNTNRSEDRNARLIRIEQKIRFIGSLYRGMKPEPGQKARDGSEYATIGEMEDANRQITLRRINRTIVCSSETKHIERDDSHIFIYTSENERTWVLKQILEVPRDL